MPSRIILLACFRLNFEEEKVDCSHKDLSERDPVSTVIGSKGMYLERGLARRSSMVGVTGGMVFKKESSILF